MPFFGDLHVHTRFSADAYIYRHARRAARRVRLRARARPIAVVGHRRGADPQRTPRPPARLRRRHRPRRVLRRGRSSARRRARRSYDIDICQHPPLARSRRRRPVPARSSSGSFPPASTNPPPSLPVLHRARRRLRRAPRCRCGRRSRPRPRRPTTARAACTLHQLRRLRAHAEPARPAPPPQRHLPQRPRAAVRLQPARDRGRTACRRASGTAIETQLPERRHRLRRRHHPAQLEPQRRPAVRGSGRRGRGAAPPARSSRSSRSTRSRATRSAASTASRGMGVGTDDELCTFEQLPVAHEGPDDEPPPADRRVSAPQHGPQHARRTASRFEQTLGVNPFQLGFVGGTDTHNAHRRQHRARSGWDGGARRQRRLAGAPDRGRACATTPAA